MNETQLWYCDFCDKKINFKNKSDFSFLNPIYTTKNIVSLLKNISLLNLKLMKSI